MLYLCTWTLPYTGTVPVTLRWEECASTQYIYFNYDGKAGGHECVKGSGDKSLSDNQYGLDTTTGDNKIPPDDKIGRTRWIPERLHLRLLRRIQHHKIINVNEGSLRVHRAQVQLLSRHIVIPRERNEYRSPIADEADRRRGLQRNIHGSEVFLVEIDNEMCQYRIKTWW